MRHFVLLAVGMVLLLLPMTGHAQAKLEIQTHWSITTGDLGEVSKGGVGNVLGGLSFPVTSSGDVHFIVKVGYNQYGGNTWRSAGIWRRCRNCIRSGIPFVGGFRVYNSEQTLFVETATGTELKQGRLNFREEDKTRAAFIGSIGAGAFVWRGLGVAGTYNISSGSWQYANLGIVYRF